MEIEVLQNTFAKALTNASRLANPKADLSTIGNILIKTNKSEIVIESTNLEIASVQKIPAKIIKQGSITAPGKLIADYINNLPNTKITLIVKNNIITIKSDKNTSNIHGYSDDDYPEIPLIEDNYTARLSIDKNKLVQAISQITPCASQDITRQILTGVFIHTVEKAIYMTATDGYRLAERKNIAKSNNEIEAIIPVTTLQELAYNINDDIKEVEITLNDTQIQFTINENIITSKLIDGTYPNYKQLIPNSNDKSAVVNRDELIKAVKISRLFTRDSGGAINLCLENNKLIIKSITSELGESTSEIPVIETPNKTINVTLNSKYLSDALNTLNTTNINIESSGKLTPFILKPENDNTYQYIIMPIKS
jgi:DNA polymerase-3 subunit beta